MTEKQKQELREQLSDEITQMQAQIQEREVQIKDTETQMNEIKNHVRSMIDQFRQSHFYLSVASHQHYDDDLFFNENNITSYLAELEEYVSHAITYLATREKNPDAPISALSLDNMANKEFDKGTMGIDAPHARDFVNIDDETTQDDEMITNPKDLYRKFEDLAKKGYVGQGHAQSQKTKH